MITSELLQELDLNRYYAIYPHGKIIEEQGNDAEDPEYGKVEYQERLKYWANGGVNMISTVREQDPDTDAVIRLVKQQISRLLAARVPAEQISVIGFSIGGALALEVSSQFIGPNLNYVIIAICGEWLEDRPEICLHGRVLSIDKQSDELGGSCRPLASRSDGILALQEIEYDTGLRHDAFYSAIPDWLALAQDWILGNDIGAVNGASSFL